VYVVYGCCGLQENVARHGLTAINLTLDFDEVSVLGENLTYLHSTLEVGVSVIVVVIIISTSLCLLSVSSVRALNGLCIHVVDIVMHLSCGPWSWSRGTSREKMKSWSWEFHEFSLAITI